MHAHKKKGVVCTFPSDVLGYFSVYSEMLALHAIFIM